MPTEQQSPEGGAGRAAWKAKFASLAAPLRAVVARLPGAARRPWIPGVLLVVLLAGAGTLLSWRQGSKSPEPVKATLKDALAAMDAGQWDAARGMAAQLRSDPKLPFEQQGGPLLILGAAMAEQAEQPIGDLERRQLNLIAARYLEEAQRIGFPEGRASSGCELLGDSLFAAERYADSLAAYQNSLQLDDTRRTQLIPRLGEAALRAGDLERALEYNDQFQADSQQDAARRREALKQRCRILLPLGRLSEMRAHIAELTAETNEDAQVRSLEVQLLIAEGDQRRGEATSAEMPPEAAAKYEQALQRLTPLSDQENGSTPLRQRFELLSGIVHGRLGNERDAAALLSLARRTNGASQEGFAAGFEEAELLRRQGNHVAALAIYRQLFQEGFDAASLDQPSGTHGDGVDYYNPFLPQQQLQARLLAAYSAYRDAGKFQEAVELARVAAPALGTSRSLQLRAAAHQAWAISLQERLAGEVEAADALEADVQKQFAAAGQVFEQLAREKMASRDYPEHLWDSASSYLNGKDYRSAVRLLQRYLRHETRRRRPRVLVALGQSYLALHRLDQALEPLLECVAFHGRDPDSYRARLLAAQVYVEKKQLDEAKQLLQDNLHNEALAPRSVEWRDSLFALARITYRQAEQLLAESRLEGIDTGDAEKQKAGLEKLETAYAHLQEAIDLLDQAVQRYANTPQTLEALYRKAQAHRMAAKLPRQKLATLTIEASRTAASREIQQHLLAALADYRQLIGRLNELQTHEELTREQQAMLRNCHFAEGDSLFEAGRYDEAIEVYRTAINRYQDEPEVLEAYVQIASCQRRLNQQEAAQRTIEQARLALDRIRADADFTRTTRYDRAQWSEMLNWLGSL